MLISIITVCFNSESNIEKTILSVINQDYKNIEYIIIDGNSKDNTVEIIKKYQLNIKFWISEPDNGIYDAMNKGIKKSTGELIYFLNSDDFFYNNSVISNIANDVQSNCDLDLIYGKINRFTKQKTGLILDIHLSIKNLKNGKMPSHQSIFVKKSLFKTTGLFNLKYKSAADFDFLCKVLKLNLKIYKTNNIIANYSIEGYSSVNYNGMFETMKIIRTNFGILQYIFSLFRFYPTIIFRFIAIKTGFMKFYRTHIYPKFLKSDFKYN